MPGFISISTGTNRTFWKAIRELCGIDALAQVVAGKASQSQVTALSNTVNQKANSAQAAWADITLLAGAAYDDPAPGFYKDTLGRVHLRGAISAPDGQDAAQLPVGSRPAKEIKHQYISDGGGFVVIRVKSNGMIQLNTAAGVGTHIAWLDQVSFRAEL